MNLKIEPLIQMQVKQKHYWKELCWSLWQQMQDVNILDPTEGLIETCATLVADEGFDIDWLPEAWHTPVQKEIERRAWENWDGGYVD